MDSVSGGGIHDVKWLAPRVIAGAIVAGTAGVWPPALFKVMGKTKEKQRVNFRDFMTSTEEELRSLTENANRPIVARALRNPTTANIERLISHLSNDRKCQWAEAMLVAVGPMALPSLEKAALDPAYHSPQFRRRGGDPLAQIMYLIGQIAPAAEFETAVKLMVAAEPNARRVAAGIIGKSGRMDAIPLIEQLLNDPDGYVRSSVWHGAREVIEQQSEFRAALYPLFLRQCGQDWLTTSNDAPGYLACLDEARALADLADESLLSADNPALPEVLRVLAYHRVRLPEARIRRLLDRSLSHLDEEFSYPHEYIVASCLVLMAEVAGKAAEPEIRALCDCRHEQVQRAVGDALCLLAGLSDPKLTYGIAWKRSASKN